MSESTDEDLVTAHMVASYWTSGRQDDAAEVIAARVARGRADALEEVAAKLAALDAAKATQR